jgi:hypothetical protein
VRVGGQAQAAQVGAAGAAARWARALSSQPSAAAKHSGTSPSPACTLPAPTCCAVRYRPASPDAMRATKSLNAIGTLRPRPYAPPAPSRTSTSTRASPCGRGRGAARCSCHAAGREPPACDGRPSQHSPGTPPFVGSHRCLTASRMSTSSVRPASRPPGTPLMRTWGGMFEGAGGGDGRRQRACRGSAAAHRCGRRRPATPMLRAPRPGPRTGLRAHT